MGEWEKYIVKLIGPPDKDSNADMKYLVCACFVYVKFT